MDIDIFLGLEGKDYCHKASFGLVKVSDSKTLINANVRRTINENEECEYTPVRTPKRFCDPDITIQPEYPFDIGEEILVDSMKYGYYIFSTGNPANPTAEDLAKDMDDNPGNYTTTGLVPSLGITLAPDELSYHVIRVPLATDINILDVTGADSTAFFEIATDDLYKYYRARTAMAPYSITYTVQS